MQSAKPMADENVWLKRALRPFFPEGLNAKSTRVIFITFGSFATLAVDAIPATIPSTTCQGFGPSNSG